MFDTIDANKDVRTEVYAALDIRFGRKHKPATLKVKVDTGAQGNVLPLRIYRQMCPENLDTEGYPQPRSLKTCSTVLTAYNGERIVQYGTMLLPCTHRDAKCDAEFYVADTPGPAIMGLPSCRALQLVTMHCEISSNEHDSAITTKEDLRKIYPDRFKGIGNFDGQFHITTDLNVTPVVHAPRRCSIHMRDEIKSELENMESLGVIKRVTQPTDWVSSIVYSRKSSGQLRICLDPKDLNKAVKRPHYRTPSLDEVTHKLAGAKIFSKLDARHGYWSVSLDDESSLKTTFNSPFGRFCFTRLPIGLNLSQDVFQERMDNILEHCSGTMSIADDVGVLGKDEAEHDANLHNLMKTARRHGLVFNIDKCEIKRQSLKFFGLVFDAEGAHPDPKRIRDIEQMGRPANSTELQEFLGIATYMSPFLLKLSQQTAPLRDLLKKEAEFEWKPLHDAVFEDTKALICRHVTLSYVRPEVDRVVQVDASSRGLVQFSTKILQELRGETQADDELCALKTVITDGWPERQSSLPATLRPYWSCRDELSIEDSLIMKGDRLVIPSSMQVQILAKLHESHQGIVKTRLRARATVYWKNINRDIDEIVRKCDVCQQMQRSQPHEPLKQHEVPTRPWQIVGTDLFVVNGDSYLIICDYCSKFPFVYKIDGQVTSDAVIQRMKGVFAEQGCPTRVVSDNGGHYSSFAFRKFAEAWGFDHVTSSPHYPQSNGFIERQVQTVKATMKKVAMTKSDLQMALLVLRATPVDSHLPSPAEMLNARKFKTNVPVKMRNEHWRKEDIGQRLTDRQTSQRINHDRRGATDLARLIPGQDVRVQDTTTGVWQPAKVVSLCPEPRSYNVQSPSGNMLKRNRRHIRETQESHAGLHQQDDNSVPNESEHQTQTTVEPVTPSSQNQHPKKTVRFEDSAERTSSGRRVKPPKRLDL